jgi:hypothetical protein
MGRERHFGARAEVARILVVGSLLVAGTSAARESTPAAPIDDGRDPYTLFYRHPVNRQLAAQLQAPDQDFRLGRDHNRWTFLADLSLGTEQAVTPATTQARFHGYYLVDTYVSAHLLDGLEANLNVLLFNPSSSDGYRVSAQLATGFCLHGWLELARPWNRALRLDVFGTDLGWVTAGVGLLLEQVPLEGATARLSLDAVNLTYTFAGRAFWDDDDVSRLQLSALDGRVGLTWIDWRIDDPDQSGTTSKVNAEFLSAYADLPLSKGFRIAAELGLRGRRGHESGALGRADYLGRPSPFIELHVGYQFRWYQRLFGPRNHVVQPSVPFNTPQQEDVYATNSFEFFGISSLDDQWSHTIMLEARARPAARLQLFLQGELWIRFASSPDGTITFTPNGCGAPGRCTDLLFRAGATAKPWRDLPHRINAYLTNKQVSGHQRAVDPVLQRFQPGTYLVVELQAFL